MLWRLCPTQGDMALAVRVGFAVGFTVYSLDDHGLLGILRPCPPVSQILVNLPGLPLSPEPHLGRRSPVWGWGEILVPTLLDMLITKI